MTSLYFAYGSNLHSGRMRFRVPEARSLGSARLPGARLVCNKLGRDGTAKANLVEDPSGLVWGVLWRIETRAWELLDRFEGGYARTEVRVETLDGSEHHASTYVSERVMEQPVPSARYLRWLLDGAREHGLPADWIAHLNRLPTEGTAGP